jgi:drug/metabolite transporter (DMT)-like permease
MDLFLASTALSNSFGNQDMIAIMPSWVKSAFAGVMFVGLLIYIYFALAFMAIGRKAKLHNPGIAWINPIISIFEISKMHWWPWAMLISGIIIAYMFALVNPIVTVIIYFLVLLAFLIMVIIWHWKTFEVVGKPGWWAVLPIALGVLGIILPFITNALVILSIILWVASAVLYAIFVGIAAWSKK